MFTLQSGQKIVLKQRLGENLEGTPYEFVVEGVALDEVLLFPADRKLDISTIFVPGEIVTGFVPGNPPYQFQAVVIRARRIPMPMLVLSAPEQVTVVERRRYFRIRVLFDAKIAFALFHAIPSNSELSCWLRSHQCAPNLPLGWHLMRKEKSGTSLKQR